MVSFNFNFKWSTPTRCSGARVLPLIPNEIYLEIFEYIAPSNETTTTLEDKRILLGLALVCRFFCATLLPRVFKSLEFSGDFSRDSGPRYLSFCKALVKKKQPARSLALHVRECTLSDYWHTEAITPRVYSRFLNLHIRAIVWMKNLESLTLHASPISRRLLRTMIKLTKLKILSFRGSWFDDDVQDVDISRLSTLRLDTLDLHFDPDHIELVKLSTAALRVFRTNNWDIAQSFMTQTTQSFIEELSLKYVDNLVTLREFLDRTPSIKTLTITNVASVNIDRLHLAPSSLPQLRFITCPSSLILEFIHSRPLEMINLSGIHYHKLPWAGPSSRQLTPDDIALLPKSCTTIRTIDIPASLYLNIPIGQHFPYLDELRLDFTHRVSIIREPRCGSELSNIITALCDAWTETPPIRELVFHFWERDSDFLWDLELQHQIIVSTIMRTFPTITRISFHCYVQWEIESHSGDWRAFVSHRDHAYIQSRVDTLRSGWKDYNGCFAVDFEKI